MIQKSAFPRPGFPRPWLLALCTTVACADDGDGDAGDASGGSSAGTATTASATSEGESTSSATTIGATTAAGTTRADTSASGTSAGSASGTATAGTSAATSTGTSAATTAASTTTSGTTAGTTGGEAALCFEGGAPIGAVMGSGTCADPFIIDMTATAHGTVVTHDVAGGGDEQDMSGGGCDTPPVGTARDVVFQVDMPNDVARLDVSVDGAPGSDSMIAVAEDPSCNQPMNACIDAGLATQCEGLEAAQGPVFFGNSTFVVVSETIASGATWTVRFRTAN